MKPRVGLSLIVTLNRGPGIMAPESARTKDDPKIVSRAVIV